MPKYAIAFKPDGQVFVHKTVETDTEQSAIRFFFDQHITEDYTQDDEGFNYFYEDFTDTDSPMGSIIQID